MGMAPRNAGSGLSDSKLAQATATEANVWKGKTFYAGDKDEKTGSLSLTNASVSVSGSGQQYKYDNQWRYRIENGGVSKTDNTITIRAVIRQLLVDQEITTSTNTMTYTITL